MTSIFKFLYLFFQQRRRLFYLSILAVFILTGYLASRIRFEEDISKLIPSNEESARVNEVLRQVKFADKIIINIQAGQTGDLPSLQRYADELSALTQKNAAVYIQKIQARMEDSNLSELLDFVSAHIPLFLNKQDYQQLDSLLQPAAIQQKVQDSYRALISPSGLISTPFLRQDPFGMTFMGLEKFKQLQSGDNFTLEDGYLVSHNRKNLLIFITPAANANETAQNSELIRLLDQNVRQLNEKYAPRTKADYFGATAVAVANARQIKKDIQITLSIAFVLLFALFIYFYRRIQIPLIILFPAVFGSLLGVMALFLLKGTISAVSIGIGSVLLGLTLDYSLHILSHYRSSQDIGKLFESITRPLLMCAVFTAVDFLCLLFLKSDVLQDLGIFAAVSVMGAALFALVFIPQVYTPDKEVRLKQHTFIDTLSAYDFSQNKWALLVCLALTVISIFTFQNVRFNNDLQALNYQPAALKEAEARLDSLDNYSSKSVYLVVYGETYADALEKNSALYQRLQKPENSQYMLSFNSIGGIILSSREQQQKIQQWQAFWTAEKKEALTRALIREGEKVNFRENTFQPFFDLLKQDFKTLQPEDYAVLNALFLDEFVSSGSGLTTITSMVKTNEENATTLIDRLSKDQEGLLVIDRKHLQEKFLSNLEADFNKLFLISSIAVFVVIFLFFGSLELTLITNIPIFLGWYITLGLMGAFGIQFNAFNIIITTLIFGLGVDYSIFITKGLLEQYTYGKADMPAYKSGIVMSALTTMLCFGVLIFAGHPAIRSIALIPLIGLLTVVIISFTVQPWLFRIFILNPQQRGNTPWRIFNLVLTLLTFGYFFIGTFILNMLAQLLIPLLPISKKKKFRFFHKVVQLFFKILIYFTPFIRIKVRNRLSTPFEKPVIIIANHTSILDTPTMGMLHPQQIFMVNNRVLHSVFFGRAIQMAGFHSTSSGYEENVVQLQEKVRQGYSVIIFPEGTRSTTGEIGRFHKGAFYLAEKLKLDILPVMIHGNTDLLPKNDNMLKTGKMTISFLPKIAFDDSRYGTNYTQRAKNIAAWFKTAFHALRQEEEGPDYFKNKVYFNYIYKSRTIQQAIKSAFQKNKTVYNKLTALLPAKATILHIGCDYGVLDFLLAYSSGKRSITATDADPEKILAAQNTYSVKRYALHFVQQIPESIRADVLILSQEWQEGAAVLAAAPSWIVTEGETFKNFRSLEGPDYHMIFQQEGIRVYQKHARGI